MPVVQGRVSFTAGEDAGRYVALARCGGGRMSDDLHDLSGKVVLVAGADPAGVEAAAQAFTHTGAVTVECCSAREGELRRVVHRTVHQHGRIDAVFNVAGGGAPATPLATCPNDVWEQTLLNGVLVPFWVCREVVPAMQRQGGGVIVNVTAALPGRSLAGRSATVAAHWALQGLTRALDEELADSGIRVNAVDPGVAAGRRRSASQTAPARERLGAVLRYLASPESDAVSGTCIKAATFEHPGRLVADEPAD